VDGTSSRDVTLDLCLLFNAQSVGYLCCCVIPADWLLQDTWSHVEFKFTQHKGTDVYLVKMAEEDFEALEDNQVLVQV